MNVVAQLYTVREFTQSPEDIDATLNRVASIGFRHVHCSKLGPIEPEHLKDLLDKHNLKCVVTHTDPERILNDIDSVIIEHRILGCTSIGMSMMPERYRDSLDGLRAMIKDYLPIIKKIDDSGLTFHYHNHEIEFIRSGNENFLEILLHELPSAYLLMCAYWVQVGGGDPVEYIKKYGSRMLHIHLKDMAVGPNRTRVMFPAFEGNMNYSAIITACQSSSMVENLIIEQDTCATSPFNCLEIGFKNVKKYLSEEKGAK